MRTIITGGCGFIGSHVVEHFLEKGHEVCVLDNLSTGRIENLEDRINRVDLVKCDIAQKGDWAKKFESADWVIHLAGLADIVPSIKQPEAYYLSNVQGTFNVLEAARTNNAKKLVYAASSSCYGIPDKYPTPETAQIKPQYPYALTKRLGEELVLHWAQIYKLPAISLRLFNVYGPRSRTSGAYGAVFGVFLAQKLADKPFTVVGDGTQTRDFIFVKDVAKAFYMAAESPVSGESYNVGGGNPVPVNKIAELLSGEKIYVPKRPGEPDCTWADIKKIQKDLGWKPSTSFETGVQEMLQKIDYWKNAPVWNPDSIKEATKDWFKYLGK